MVWLKLKLRFLSRRLRGRSEYDSKEAAEPLAKMGEAAIGVLVKCLEDEQIQEDWCAYVRLNVVKALDSIGEKQVVEPLLRVAVTDRDPDVQSDATRALRRIGEKRAVGPLLRLALSHPKSASENNLPKVILT